LTVDHDHRLTNSFPFLQRASYTYNGCRVLQRGRATHSRKGNDSGGRRCVVELSHIRSVPQQLNYVTRLSDQVILARITIEERPLRRIIKKFHTYTSLSHTPIVPVLNDGHTNSNSVDDAREAFLVELATFQLSMKKNAMICEAEARQVEEYHRERERLGMFIFDLLLSESYWTIDNEHETLTVQIEELKTALEHAQMLRRRKIEYDLVAEKVNALPSRDELES